MFPPTGIWLSYTLTIQPSIKNDNLSSVPPIHPCICRSTTRKKRSNPLLHKSMCSKHNCTSSRKELLNPPMMISTIKQLRLQTVQNSLPLSRLHHIMANNLIHLICLHFILVSLSLSIVNLNCIFLLPFVPLIVNHIPQSVYYIRALNLTQLTIFLFPLSTGRNQWRAVPTLLVQFFLLHIR